MAIKLLPRDHVFAGLPARAAGTLLVDPPWDHKTYTPHIIGSRDARRHFKVMSLAATAALPLADIAAPDCHLWCWTTAQHFLHAIDMIEAWGWRYSSIGLTSLKLRKNCAVLTSESDLRLGQGHTTRKGTEICILARRGSPRRLSGGVREVIVAPIREYGRKPDEAYERIESYAAGPYVELFARASWPRWLSWGDEAGKFDVEGSPCATASKR